MKNHHKGHPIHPIAPLHADIACRAHDLWNYYGQPQSQDETIWLEAEAQLVAGITKSPETPKLPVSF